MKVITWNVQGLRTPNKGMKVLRHLKRHGVDVAVPQESHLKESDFQRMRKIWVGEVMGSLLGGRKAGVLILLHKRLKYTIGGIQMDKEGGKILVLLKTQSTKIQISNIYTLNSPNKAFYQDLTTWLSSMTSHLHLAGGTLIV